MGFGEIDRRALELARKAGRVPPKPGPWKPPPNVEHTRQARRAAEAERRTSERSQLRADQALIDHDREAARRLGIAIGTGITALAIAGGLWAIFADGGRPATATARRPGPGPGAPATAPDPGDAGDASDVPAPVTELSGAAPPAPGLPRIAIPAPALDQPAGRATLYRDLLGTVDAVLHGVRFDAASAPTDAWPKWLPPEKVAARLAAARAVAAGAAVPTALDRAVLAYVDVVERDLPAWQAATALRADDATRADGVARQAALSDALGAAAAAVRDELAGVGTSGVPHPYQRALDVCRAGVDLVARASTVTAPVVERPADAVDSVYGPPPSPAALGEAAYACLDAVVAADRAHPGGAYVRDLLLDLGNALLSLRDQALAGHGLYPSHATQLSLFATEQLERLRTPSP